MEPCTLCPRACNVLRSTGTGFCGGGNKIKAARAALHFYEETCISGTRGSGAVFFSGCSLRCIFCQNRSIALGKDGREISVSRLSDIFFELRDKGANNINLVTAGHYLPLVIRAMERAKARGFDLPFVYNTGSYEKVSAIKDLDGLVDVYLPDLKYFSKELSEKFSHAPDYFDLASAAIAEMVRQTREALFAPEDEREPASCLLMKKGVIVRHLVLPGHTKDSMDVLSYLHNTYENRIYVSIMNQYTPLAGNSDLKAYPELLRTVTKREYEKVLNHAIALGIENGFFQEGKTVGESFIPEFNQEGL